MVVIVGCPRKNTRMVFPWMITQITDGGFMKWVIIIPLSYQSPCSSLYRVYQKEYQYGTYIRLITQIIDGGAFH